MSLPYCYLPNIKLVVYRLSFIDMFLGALEKPRVPFGQSQEDNENG